MEAERWRKTEEIFQAALELSGDEREQFVRAQCGGDEDLRREVEKYLKLFETEDSFLESPVWTDSQFLQSQVKREIASSLENTENLPPAETFADRRVGVYRLIEELGRGGMGIVYLGERADGEFRQQVAVKLIKRGMDTDFILSRFRQERQILAALSSPNIARLLDGGTTADDLPYFVMEYVEGKSFLKFCEFKNYDLRRRLELFLPVCRAIAHAHRRKIIHRDIKPTNILVTDEGVPKLLDFGIAKILDPDLIHESVSPTATQMRLMTPEYASPEQVRGEEITPASDQYSLGVLLYELITGQRPYKFSSRAPHEIARIICDEAPIRPSLSIDRLSPKSTADSDSKNSSNGIFRIDEALEKILFKSLSKSPAKRYPSVEEFSADIERYLNHQPVLAESPTTERKTFSSAEQKKSIAVLPLKIVNVAGGTDEDAFLSVGLADALITRLSKVRQILVCPTSSVLRYADSEATADSFAAGAELNVEFVLEGNVIKTEARIRVSVQLLKIADRSVVWAERFDEKTADFLEFEHRISLKVAEAIVPQMTTGEIRNLAKRGTENVKAYEAYLRGRYHWNTFTEEGFAQAFVAYHEAITEDPDYALAYAGIADYYIWLGVYGILPPKNCYPPAKDAAAQAIALDAGLADAYSALGFAQLCGDYDWIEAEKNMIRAVELNPNYAVARLWYSYVLLTAGRFNEGIRQAQQAVELDSLTYTNHHVLAWAFYFARRFDEAVEQAARNVKKFPGIGLAYFTQSWILRFLGRHEESLRASQRALELTGDSLFVLLGQAQSLAAAGHRASTEETLRRAFEQGEKQYLSYYQVALVHAYAGAAEDALDALERAFDDGEGWLIWLRTEPALDRLRREPRFARLRKTVERRGIGKPDETIDTQAATLAMNQKSIAPMATIDSEQRISLGAAKSEITVPTSDKKARRTRLLKYALAAIILIIGGCTGYFIYSRSTVSTAGNAPRTEDARNGALPSAMSVKRLTTSGNEQAAAISPDGKQIAFVSGKDEAGNLWIRQIDSENADQLVAPGSVSYSTLIFSPDGRYVYYVTFNQTYTERLLWRIPAAGGTPQKILSDVVGGITLTADGRRVACFSYNSNTKLSSVMIADLAENGALLSLKTVATRLQPEYFAGNPAISPDGGKIVYAVAATAAEKVTANFYAFDVESGAEEKLPAPGFNYVTAIRWRENADELIFNANLTYSDPAQLWTLAYPSGEVSPLSNDLNNYEGISLTKNSDALVTMKTEMISNVGVVGWENGASVAETIIEGTNRQDGIAGILWLPDNRILYISSNGDKNSVVLANPDGTNRRMFDLGDAYPSDPLLTGDGRYLFFIDQREQKFTLRRYETATGAFADIVSQSAQTPTLTADSRFVIYAALNDEHRQTLHRVPVEGGAATQLTSIRAISPSVSPDNRLIACYFMSETGGGWQLGIFSIEGGAPLRIINPVDSLSSHSLLDRPLSWSADSRWLYYLNDKGTTSNIFRVTTDGTNKTEQITKLPSGIIFNFALSPDRKRAVVARGSMSNDIVLFRNLR